MRRRFAIPLIAALGAAPWYALKPPGPDVAANDQPAQHVATFSWEYDAPWFGGISGIDLRADGEAYVAITDRGHIFSGSLSRTDEVLSNATIERFQQFVDAEGRVREFPHTDAEGVSFDPQGRVLVSFEHAHRVLRYDTWEGPAVWPSYTRSWRALSNNGGLEFLAVDAEGTILTIPEARASGATEALVYRRIPKERWDQPFTLPLGERFVPVGGDITDDGTLYLLERDHYPFGFVSRVREMMLDEDGFTKIRTVLHTKLGQFGNLEGLAVSKDQQGRTRLTMVSDDNFLFFQRSHIVEYVLAD